VNSDAAPISAANPYIAVRNACFMSALIVGLWAHTPV
jgi:hypothetical protein